jgi:hypothetical protein
VGGHDCLDHAHVPGPEEKSRASSFKKGTNFLTFHTPVATRARILGCKRQILRYEELVSRPLLVNMLILSQFYTNSHQFDERMSKFYVKKGTFLF